jgi:hypothetical protein
LKRTKAHVDFLLLQGGKLVGSEHFAQGQPHRRVVLAIGMQGGWQDGGKRQGGGKADAQLADFPACGAARLLGGVFGISQNAPGTLQKLLTGCGQLTLRFSRRNRATPSSASSAWICWDKGGWAMCSRSAARVKCSSSATVTK